MVRWFYPLCVLSLCFTAGVGTGISQELEPEEPEIVLPSVVLEIEDLSIESVTSALPEEEGLLPSEPPLPLPEAEELAVQEPQLDLALPPTGSSVFEVKEGKYLSAEAILGAGTGNEFFSRISLFFLGDRPEGKILFQHETIDGFSSESQGTGYNTREDTLEGYIDFDVKNGEFDLEGSFSEYERGLQENGLYFSKINRFVDLGAGAVYRFNDWVSLKGSMSGSSSNRVLTDGPSPADQIVEYYIMPSIAAEFSFERWYFGVEPRASYRSVPEMSDLSAGRMEVRGYLGADVTDYLYLDGGVGWFWSEETSHLVPFDLTLTAALGDFLSLRIGGGYRIVEYQLRDVFRQYPLSDVPASLEDNHGWYGDVRANWIPTQGWIVDAGALYFNNSSMPTFGRTVDATTGLFPFTQVDAKQLSVDAGVRWIISELLSARAGIETEIFDRPEFSPESRLTIDMDLVQPQGKYGAGASLDFTSGVNDTSQLPVLDLDGFFRLNQYVRFVIEADDVLAVLLEDSRYSWEPYIDPGFLLKAKVHINF